MLTADIARSLLGYEPETGDLVWLPRAAEGFATAQACSTWNTRYAGKVAGSVSARYRRLHILNGSYLAHRVIWLLVNGEWPSADIDHINGDCLDNRFDNLRDVPHSENARNMRLNAKNTSGACGVVWCRKAQKWNARIRVDGRSVHLGSFSDIGAAVAVRKAAEQDKGFHPNHGRAA